MNYFDVMQRQDRGAPEYAAVLHPGKVKAKPLTKGRNAGPTTDRSDNSGNRRETRERKSARTASEGSPMAKTKKGIGPKRAKKSGSKAKTRKSSKRVEAGKKAAATRKRNERAAAAAKSAPKKPRKKSGKKASAKKGRKASTKKPKKGTKRKSAAAKRGGSSSARAQVSVRVARETPKRKSGRKGRRRSGTRRSRETYAMENPLSPTELFVGALTGLLGFGAADFADRLLATHTLTDKGSKDANGNELYADTPPTTGSYIGLYNASAILAPMDWKRWLAGGAIVIVPMGAAYFVKSGMGRSALQMFGFGAFFRVGGKAFQDLAAKLLAPKTQMGLRLYDGEARAAALRAVNGNASDNSLGSYPTTGLGHAPARIGAGGCGCKNCSAGVGACCGKTKLAPGASASPPAPPPPPPPPPANTVQVPVNTPVVANAHPGVPVARPGLGDAPNGAPRRSQLWGEAARDNAAE